MFGFTCLGLMASDPLLESRERFADSCHCITGDRFCQYSCN